MQPERFLRDMRRLCKACSAESIETWIHWARECVGAKQYLNLIPLPDEQAVSAWLDSYYASFYFIKQEFGAETAAKVVELSRSRLCLYPFELRTAAQVLKDGGGAAQIQQRMEDGTLEDYGKIPAMEDVKNNIRARKGKEL